MTDKVSLLIVDDEVEVLKALTRIFRKRYQVHATSDPLHAVELLKKMTFAVVISDMRMPEMTGDKLLEQAYLIAPDTPRLLLTGYSDMESTANAINLGRVSNYISKPWDNQEIIAIVEQSAEQFHLQQAAKCYRQQIEGKNKALSQRLDKDKSLFVQLNKRIQQKTHNTRNLFHDVVELINQISTEAAGDQNGHIKRVALHCRLLAKRLNLEPSQVSQCYLAGLMHEIGKVSLPDDIINACENDLTHAELEQKKQHAILGANIISTIPALSHIADIVKHQYELVDGSGVPDHLVAEEVPIEVKVLSVVNEYDKLILGKVTGKPMTPEQAKQHMSLQSHFDQQVKNTYFKMLEQHQFDGNTELDICIGTLQLEAGMILSRDIVGKSKTTLLTKDTEITQHHIQKLKDYEKEWNTILNVFVL